METNLYHLTAEQRRERGIVSLPETLGEATDELARQLKECGQRSIMIPGDMLKKKADKKQEK